MKLFPDSLLNNVEHDNESNVFKQLSLNPKPAVIGRLNTVFGHAGTPVQERWLRSMDTTDKGRFFQAYAEATASAFLQEAGWEIADLCSPRPCLVARREDGRETRLVVLAFIQSDHQHALNNAVDVLSRAVDRSGTQSRVAVTVHRWSDHPCDPEPVRRAIELWMQQVDRGKWLGGRYARYEDDHVHLEFSLTDEPMRPGQSGLAFVLGPQNGLKTMEIIETRLVYELDTLLSKGNEDQSVVVCLATNTTWSLNPGHIRSLLYGRPSWQVTNGAPQQRAFGFLASGGPSLFTDPLYRRVSGVIMLDQHPDRGPCARAYLNPWASNPIGGDQIACATLSNERSEGDLRVMRWTGIA